MKSYVTLSIWILTFLIGGALFWTSNEVQIAESASKKLANDIRDHEERITILSAEWHYLNSPAYLDELTTLAFNDKVLTSKPVMLTDSGDLPKIQLAMLPVRKPEVPEEYKNIRKESAPIIVAAHKKVQSVTSSQAPLQPKAAVRPKKQNDFSMVLASWTE